MREKIEGGYIRSEKKSFTGHHVWFNQTKSTALYRTVLRSFQVDQMRSIIENLDKQLYNIEGNYDGYYNNAWVIGKVDMTEWSAHGVPHFVSEGNCAPLLWLPHHLESRCFADPFNLTMKQKEPKPDDFSHLNLPPIDYYLYGNIEGNCKIKCVFTIPRNGFCESAKPSMDERHAAAELFKADHSQKICQWRVSNGSTPVLEESVLESRHDTMRPGNPNPSVRSFTKHISLQ